MIQWWPSWNGSLANGEFHSIEPSVGSGAFPTLLTWGAKQSWRPLPTSNMRLRIPRTSFALNGMPPLKKMKSNGQPTTSSSSCVGVIRSRPSGHLFVRYVCLTILLIRKLDTFQIRASSLCRQHFSAILKDLGQKDLQLLRDVRTRWSSTLFMIERAIGLRDVSTIVPLLGPKADVPT